MKAKDTEQGLILIEALVAAALIVGLRSYPVGVITMIKDLSAFFYLSFIRLVIKKT